MGTKRCTAVCVPNPVPREFPWVSLRFLSDGALRVWFGGTRLARFGFSFLPCRCVLVPQDSWCRAGVRV